MNSKTIVLIILFVWNIAITMALGVIAANAIHGEVAYRLLMKAN